jgi:cytochrome c oxidase subunit 2
MRRIDRLAAAGMLLAAGTLCALSRGRAQAAPERVIHVTARRFAYEPSEIVVKQGEPVILELEALDREHGFRLPALHLRADLAPGQVARVPLVAPEKGHFPFACDVFCGSGHEDMTGELVVE